MTAFNENLMFHLAGIQLAFANGIESPHIESFQSKRFGSELSVIKIEEDIRSVSFLLRFGISLVSGMRFYNDADELIVDEVWSTELILDEWSPK